MDDDLQLRDTAPVLIVGGYGTVGAELARLAAPHWPLLLAGRNPTRGAALADELGATTSHWDLDNPTAFRAEARAVVSTVNDPGDRVLRAAVRAGIPYVDITRWTARLTRAAVVAATLRPTAPVLLSSSWMGGVTGLVAAALAEKVGGATTVDIAIRYALADRAGADSVEFMDRLGQEFEVVDRGVRRMTMPLRDSRHVRIGETMTRVGRIDTPEQFTLPLTLGAETAVTRIGFDSNAASTALLTAARLGFFRRARGDRWQSLRRSMLYSPGDGAAAALRIEVSGPDGTLSATLRDPAGQAHLTAVGALLGLRRVLAGDAPVGVSFPESTSRPQNSLDLLRQYGVDIEIA
ncbi:saccharopine dehydrogenase [Nocardia sp. GCM10030253]|uniref:saccharopine dehydrogenase n=1 Tax=Nocardia sp. GCM10030253 TaxID=3273404 RepID=UPI00363C6982